jgi:hypothetical protein
MPTPDQNTNILEPGNDLEKHAVQTKSTFEVLENFPSMKGAGTITVNPKSHCLYSSVAEYEPAPAATAENPRSRPALKANSFTILEIKSL